MEPCTPLFRWQSSDFIFLRNFFLLYSLPAPSQSILGVLFSAMLAVSALRLLKKAKLQVNSSSQKGNNRLKSSLCCV
jgi:hypothetical protein